MCVSSMRNTCTTTRCVVVVHLLPSLLHNVEVSVTRRLNKMLMRYSDQLHGVVLAFSDVKFRENVGSILFERPHVTVRVEATFLVLVIKVNSVLTGKVNNFGHDYISLLCHGALPVSIPRAEFSDCLQFDENSESWWFNDDEVKLNSTVRFRVVSLSNRDGTLSISASLLRPASKTKDAAAPSEQQVEDNASQPLGLVLPANGGSRRRSNSFELDADAYGRGDFLGDDDDADDEGDDDASPFAGAPISSSSPTAKKSAKKKAKKRRRSENESHDAHMDEHKHDEGTPTISVPLSPSQTLGSSKPPSKKKRRKSSKHNGVTEASHQLHSPSKLRQSAAPTPPSPMNGLPPSTASSTPRHHSSQKKKTRRSDVDAQDGPSSSGKHRPSSQKDSSSAPTEKKSKKRKRSSEPLPTTHQDASEQRVRKSKKKRRKSEGASSGDKEVLNNGHVEVEPKKKKRRKSVKREASNS